MSDQNTNSQKTGPSTIRTVIIVLVLVAAALLFIFNRESVDMWLFGFNVTLPLFLLLIVTFILGMFLGGAVRSGLRKLRGKEEKVR